LSIYASCGIYWCAVSVVTFAVGGVYPANTDVKNTHELRAHVRRNERAFFIKKEK